MKYMTSLLLLLALLLTALHGVASRQSHSLERTKRQSNGNRAQVIDNIFQIPIQTLTAVNNLVRSTQPLLQRRRFSRGQGQRRPSRAPQFAADATRGARVAQLYTAADGSSFKI